MRKFVFFIFVLLALGMEILIFSGSRVSSNVRGALRDSVHEVQDQMVGTTKAGVQNVTDRAQNTVWHAVSNVYGRIDAVQQRMLDASISAAVKMKLANDEIAPARGIHVTTRNGVVFLSGTVERAEEAKRAEDLAWKAEGVTHVVSNIHIQEARDTGGKQL
jgi:osmotically-inducible protein OsmY